MARKNKNTKLLLSQKLSCEENTERVIARMLSAPGEIFVKKGDDLSPADLIGECRVSKGFRIFNVAEILEIKKDEVGGYLKKEIGAKIFKDEILGEKKKYLSIVTKQFISPCDGILENIDSRTGQLTIRFLPVKIKLFAGFYGKVSEVIEGKGVKIQTQAHVVRGGIGIGIEREGILRIVSNNKDIVSAIDVDSDYAKKIILGGSLINRDLIQKGITLGIKGIIGGGINARDYRNLRGSLNPKEDVGISLLVLSGFGRSEIDPKIVELLKKNENTMVIIDPQSNELIIPIKPSDWSKKLKKQKKVGFTYLKEKDNVVVISWPYLGKKGIVQKIHKEEIEIGSQIKTTVATIKIQGEKEVIFPVQNLQVI